MLAWMDDEALHRTLTTGRATYWSRSRGEYWVKGETSGNRQWVREVRARLRRRRAAAARRPGGRRPATPASAAASTGRCPPRGGGRDEVRRHHPHPRGVRGPRPPGRAGHPAAARRQRDRRRHLPQAGRQPPGHRAAGVRRAGQAVGALQLRGRAQRRRPHRARRRHGVAGRRRPRAHRRPAGRPAGRRPHARPADAHAPGRRACRR